MNGSLVGGRNAVKWIWAERELSAGSLAMNPRVNLKLVAFAVAMILPGLVAAMDGVVMKDGHMMMMKDGRVTEPMTADITMPDGTKVTTSGVVKMRDGEEKQLNNGAMVLMNGHIMRGGKATPMQPE
jgi:hypothetical protein